MNDKDFVAKINELADHVESLIEVAKGDKGDPGKDGAAGPPGKQGLPGKDGRDGLDATPVDISGLKKDIANINQKFQYYQVAGAGGSGGSVSPLTTKGDLYTFDTANARLSVGTDGQILIADSTQATGLRWGANEYVGVGVLTVADYVTTYTPALPPLAAGLKITFYPDVNNLANPTINGVLIKEAAPTGLTNLEADDLIGGGNYELTYNGTFWVLEGTEVVPGFYVQQAIVVGANVIAHNLNLATPKSVIVQVRDDATGSEVSIPVTAYAANSLTLTALSAVTLANINIK